MSQVINTNIASLNAQRSLGSTQEAQRIAMERLSSGRRINTARDDAAGLAISNSMTAQIQGLNQAMRNTNDGISLVQTAEGALSEVTSMLQRIRELKVQHSNGTNNSTQKGYLNKEFAQLADEIGGVIETTKFNGLNILSGGSSTTTIQKGWENGDTMSIGIATLQSASEFTTLFGAIADTTGAATYSSLGNAAVTLDNIDSALKKVNESRVNLGAQQNRMEHNISNLANVSENISAARSRILDADFAAESAELSRTSILQQAGMAMLSQANQMPASVLTLLR